MKKPSYNTLNTYNAISAATKIGMGFPYKGLVYLAFTDKLQRQYTYTDRQSKTKGGYKTIRFYVSTKQAQRLAKTAICVGTVADMENAENKGERFEQLVYNLFGQVWKKDTTPYYKAGDIEINGEQVQLKYTGATVTTYKQLKQYSKGL